jgi:hypothetical protein
LEAKHREGEVIDKGIEATDGILGSHVVIEPLREQDLFVAVRAVDKTHESTKLPKSKKVSRARQQCYSLPKHCVLTQSGAWFGVECHTVKVAPAPARSIWDWHAPRHTVLDEHRWRDLKPLRQCTNLPDIQHAFAPENVRDDTL